MTSLTPKFPRALAALLLTAAAAAPAQTLPPPQNVVSLAASATVEVPKDWLTVVFSTTREGSDAGVVQNQLKQALDSALAEVRKAAKPGQVEVRTGGFSLMPRYAPKGGTITGWQGSTELVVEGRDSTTIAQLTGRVQTLTIARVGFSLSREAREKVEGEVAAMAIERFRARAEAVSRQFGFGGYTVREVAVNSEGGGGQPMPVMRMQASAMMAEGAALPVEAGKATVTANVNGSVQMK
ncbi:MAG: SIMPL domain-containing protein [Rubrivivax sp.]|nr:SIMPL domain-containing protein [Rubrivivax sp.]